MTTRILAVPLALATLIVVQLANGQEVQQKLDKQLDFQRPIQAPLTDVIAMLADRMDVTISIDADEFKRNRRIDPTQTVIRLPEFSSSFAGVLREILTMAGCVYEIRDKTIVVFPDVCNGKPRPFPAMSDSDKERIQETCKKLDQKLDQDREITATVRAIVEFLGDRCDACFVFDRRAFQDAGNKNVEDKSVKLPKVQGKTLGEVLKLLLKQVDAKIDVAPGYIRIVPAGGSS